MAENVDVLIVGGGIAGLSLASELAASSATAGLAVGLVEAETTLSHHASGRSAQQLIPSYGPPVLQALTLSTLRSLAELQENEDADVRFIWPSSFMLVGDRAGVEEGAHDGMERLSETEARSLVPQLIPGSFEAAALDRASVRTDAAELLAFHAARARRGGVRVITGAPVHTAQRLGRGWLVGAGHEAYRAGVVVNAAGAWADDVAVMFGVERLGLQPYRRTAALVGLRVALPAETPMVCAADDSWYFRPDEEGVLVSPAETVPSRAEDARPSPGDVERTLERIASVATLPVTGVRRSWTGLRTSPADDHPAVGFDAEAPGFFWLAGQGGYGFQTSSALADIAARLLLAGQGSVLPGDGHPESQTMRALDPRRLSLRG